MFSSDFLAAYDAVGRYACSRFNLASTANWGFESTTAQRLLQVVQVPTYLQAALSSQVSAEVRAAVAVGTCVSRDKDTTAVPQSLFWC